MAPYLGAFFLRVQLTSSIYMARFTPDFQLITPSQDVGVVLVMPMNEEALDYITDERYMTTLPDGSLPVRTDRLKSFVNDIEHAHMCVASV